MALHGDEVVLVQDALVRNQKHVQFNERNMIRMKQTSNVQHRDSALFSNKSIIDV